LKNENTVAVARAVEGEYPAKSEGGTGRVSSWSEGLTILIPCECLAMRQDGNFRVGGFKVGSGGGRLRVGNMPGPTNDGWSFCKSRSCYSQTAGEHSISSTRHRCSKYRKVCSRAEDDGLRGHGTIGVRGANQSDAGKTRGQKYRDESDTGSPSERCPS